MQFLKLRGMASLIWMRGIPAYRHLISIQSEASGQSSPKKGIIAKRVLQEQVQLARFLQEHLCFTRYPAVS